MLNKYDRFLCVRLLFTSRLLLTHMITHKSINIISVCCKQSGRLVCAVPNAINAFQTWPIALRPTVGVFRQKSPHTSSNSLIKSIVDSPANNAAPGIVHKDRLITQSILRPCFVNSVSNGFNLTATRSYVF